MQCDSHCYVLFWIQSNQREYREQPKWLGKPWGGKQLGRHDTPAGTRQAPSGILVRPNHVWYPVTGIGGGVSSDQQVALGLRCCLKSFPRVSDVREAQYRVPQPTPRDVRDAEHNNVVMDRDLCTDQWHLANTHRKNVMFGLIRKRITCLVRIKSVRGPEVTLRGAMYR